MIFSFWQPSFYRTVCQGLCHQAHRVYLRDGIFAEVTLQGLTVLAEEAMPLAELDAAGLDQRIKNAEEDLADAKDGAHRERAQDTLDNLRQLRTALG